MLPIKPEGPADTVELRAQIEAKPGRNAITALVQHLAEVLRPFAVVEKTNERWMDEMQEVAVAVQELAAGHQIEGPSPAELNAGIQGLENYRSQRSSLQEAQAQLEQQFMKPSELNIRLSRMLPDFEEAVANLMDTWPIYHFGHTITELCRNIVLKLIGDRDEVARVTALGLFRQIHTLCTGALSKENIPKASQALLEYYLEYSGKRVRDMETMLGMRQRTMSTPVPLMPR